MSPFKIRSSSISRQQEEQPEAEIAWKGSSPLKFHFLEVRDI